jgi:hypothetical protein
VLLFSHTLAPLLTMLRQRFDFFDFACVCFSTCFHHLRLSGWALYFGTHHEEIYLHSWWGIARDGMGWGFLDWNCMEGGRHHSTGWNRDIRMGEADRTQVPSRSSHSFRFGHNTPLFFVIRPLFLFDLLFTSLSSESRGDLLCLAPCVWLLLLSEGEERTVMNQRLITCCVSITHLFVVLLKRNVRNRTPHRTKWTKIVQSNLHELSLEINFLRLSLTST